MPEMLSSAIAGRLARPLVGLAATRLKRAALGPDEERALLRVVGKAFTATLDGLETSEQEALAGVEALLRRVLEDRSLATALVDDAFGRSTLDLGLIHPLIEQNWIDTDTLAVDLPALLGSLVDNLRREVLAEARRPGSMLFNSFVVDQLDLLGRRPGPDGPGRASRLGPPPPSLLVGRDPDLIRLKGRLRIGAAPAAVQVLTTVRGWPGVGKTTVAAALIHDEDVVRAFPDGVLWATATDRSRVRTELVNWSRVLGEPEPPAEEPAAQISARLAAAIAERRMLLVIDDVWEPERARLLLIGGRRCATLVTTREPAVADLLAPTAGDIYSLEVLGRDDAILLVARFAPGVVAARPAEIGELVDALEGLPLALCVAGRMLQAEARYGWGVDDLLRDLRAGTGLLGADAPPDRADLESATTPTVAALLRQSTTRLPAELRERFADLGAFELRPASFDTAALAAVWQVADPRPTVRRLVQRGLLEPATGGRFWMHALLAMHARELLESEED
ncbi:NB-ARC domain-containing protein [Actinoplanes sp. NPDC026623]|uniref:NB-ARC domain-containing protein n=1 Tax=Actinoplanes sp. NPDC026623 TaxID=3155610 RepID=UPI003408FE19